MNKLGVATSYLTRISEMPPMKVTSPYTAGYEEGLKSARKLAADGLAELRSYA